MLPDTENSNFIRNRRRAQVDLINDISSISAANVNSTTHQLNNGHINKYDYDYFDPGEGFAPVIESGGFEGPLNKDLGDISGEIFSVGPIGETMSPSSGSEGENSYSDHSDSSSIFHTKSLT